MWRAFRYARAGWGGLSHYSSAAARNSAGWGGAVLFVPSAVAGAACYWQLERMSWKVGRQWSSRHGCCAPRLVALRPGPPRPSVERPFQEGVVAHALQQLAEPPVDFFSEQAAGGLPPYRRVSATGVYKHEAAVFVGPRPLTFEPDSREAKEAVQRELRARPGTLKSGYLMITPLEETSGGRVVLVNRGWVPPGWRAGWAGGATGGRHEPAGTVRVTGVAQDAERPSSLMPPNDVEAREFHWLDTAAIARACGLPATTPLLQLCSEAGRRSEVSDALSSQDGPEAPTRSWLQQRQSPPAAAAHDGVGDGGGEGVHALTSGGFPLPKPQQRLVAFPVMPFHHLNYSVMWGAMSLAMGFLAVRKLRGAR